MIEIDIFSGFLGAGKTTLIKKLLREAYKGEKVVLIENEFGEIGVDGGFLKDAGIQITEMNSGCICCSLVGDFAKALQEVAVQFSPDRILIEPSGVGKLSDVIKAVERASVPNARLHAFCTVVDAKKCKTYLKNFGEFFLDQVEHASCVVLSHTSDPLKTDEAVALLKEHTKAAIITTDWEKLSGKEVLTAMAGENGLKEELARLVKEAEHRHHHHEAEEEHHHHHDHHHEHHDDGHHEHHHHDGEECDDPDCECHHHHDHDEHHHGHHHADEVFSSWGKETAKVYSEEQLKEALAKLDAGECGRVLRAKGIVDGGSKWLYFDFVPGEINIREGTPAVTGRLCVIGCELDSEKIEKLF